MQRFGRRPRGIRLLLALAPLLAVAGCSETNQTKSATCPAYDVGAVQGYVLTDGLPSDANVFIRPSRASGRQLPGSFRARTDSTGWFSVAVPSGDYTIDLSGDPGGLSYHAGGVRWQGAGAETLHVGRDPVRADCLCGRLTVTVAFPAGFEGLYAYCVLWDGTPGGLVEHGYDQRRVQNGTGQFRFDRIPAGTYRLRIQSNRESIWLPPGLDPDRADTVAVDWTHAAVYTGRIDSGARISGRITGAWQAMGAYPPLLEAFDADSSTVTWTRADSSGSYALDFLLARPVRVRVTAGQAAAWIGGPDYASATVFSLQPGQEISNASFEDCGLECQLEGPGSETSHFYDVRLQDETGRDVVVDQYGESGILSTPGLRPGAYYLRVEPTGYNPDWLPQWYDGQDSLSAATPIVVSQPGDIARITMHLIAGGRIGGRLLEANGTPASMREIDCAPAGSHPEFRFLWTAVVSGEFTVTGLPDGDYIVGTTMGRAGEWWYPGTANADSAGAIAIRSHGEVDGIEWRLP